MTRVRVTPCVSAYGYARVRVRVWISVPEAKPHPYPRCYGFSRSVPDVRSSGHVPTLLININNSRTFPSHNHHHPLPEPPLGDNHHLWATTMTSGRRPPPTPSLASRARWIHLRRPQHHRHHPLSLANASWGWSFSLFMRDCRHITNTTPSRSQTRVGGVSVFHFLTTAATSPPPPSTISGRQSPPPTPPSPQERAGGVRLCLYGTTSPSLAPRARRRGLVSISTAPPPSLAPRASRRDSSTFVRHN